MDEQKPRIREIWDLYKQGGIPPAITSMFNPQSAQNMAVIRSMMKIQQKQPTLDTPLHELQAVVFDLETTGFSAYGGDAILSFGAVKVNGQELTDQHYYNHVRQRSAISEKITALTGITNEMVGQAPELLEVLHDFFNFVQKRVLIVHGSGHDKQFLNAALWKTSKTNLTHRVLDTMMIAKWLHPGRKDYDLDSLLKRYNIKITRRHHALMDAMMTAELWQAMLQEVLDRRIITLRDLYAYLS